MPRRKRPVISDALLDQLFAAGFQDHRIGKVLGSNGSTGAGSANIMTWSALRKKFEDVRAAAQDVGTTMPSWLPGEQPLPLNADLRVAVRRTARVGKRSGTELEDLGVQPSVRHRMTRADALTGNIALSVEAAELLRGMPSHIRIACPSFQVDAGSPDQRARLLNGTTLLQRG